ncbi:MAG: VCBS repeat-containing protein [Candidatus Hydrogenedentes bacterium]|nr:VCBS repeat-containing protein [Candidatus Hydrogenedentota bacterium]
MMPLIACLLYTSLPLAAEEHLAPIKYNNPGLVVDLGVGLWAWPLPMDFDGDGDYDLVVTCPDKPQAGTFFFENVDGDMRFPVFKPGVRISKSLQNAQVSYVNGKPHVLTPGLEHHQFLTNGLDTSRPLPLDPKLNLTGKLRANQWKWADYDGDGIHDLIVGIGEWTEYGWDNAYDANGNWTNGPLRGWVYFARNTGTIDAPALAEPVKLEADGKPVDGYGMPSPNLEDFDGDGDLDLICGEFLDGFTWFENIGTRTDPEFAAGRPLTYRGEPVRMDLQMIVPVAIDWDKDGDQDLIVGDEDGRVALIEHTGEIVDRMPQFKPPVYFQQQAEYLKCGALATPVSFDWDNDGDEDIVSGNTAGYIEVFENLGGSPPKWAAPKKLEADGKVIRIQAGPNGSIQGPAEAKWGYTTLSVADWDHDGLPDIVVNSIWGKVIWYRNIGARSAPKLAAAQPIEVAWLSAPPKPAWTWWDPVGNELVTQWRTTPVVIDFNADGLNDLVMLDHEGYLALFKRTRGADGALQLQPGARIFVDESGTPLLLSKGVAGKSGRRKLTLVDWDGDKRLDILINSTNCDWLKNLRDDGGNVVFKEMGALSDLVLAGHDTSPTTSDWNKDGVRELLLGAEDGRIYRLNRTVQTGSTS